MALPWGAPLTEDDLAGMPDDGHRYGLLDGTLLVTPSPHLDHQRCVGSLFVLLREARGAGCAVVVAPFGVRLSRITVLEPDVIVARSGDLTPARLDGAPLLAVEVQSPSTWRIDRGAKRLAYEEAGVPAYWLVSRTCPASPCSNWRAGGTSSGRWSPVTRPSTPRSRPVTVVPSRLLEG